MELKQRRRSAGRRGGRVTAGERKGGRYYTGVRACWKYREHEGCYVEHAKERGAVHLDAPAIVGR